MLGISMKINELFEAPKDIKLSVALITGHDVYALRNNSIKVKTQFQKLGDTPNNRIAMRSYLFHINQLIFEISQLPQWNTWSTTNDGKTVSRELDKIYFDNMNFMKRFQ